MCILICSVCQFPWYKCPLPPPPCPLPPPPSFVMFSSNIYSFSGISHHRCRLKDENPERQQVPHPLGAHRQEDIPTETWSPGHSMVGGRASRKNWFRSKGPGAGVGNAARGTADRHGGWRLGCKAKSQVLGLELRVPVLLLPTVVEHVSADFCGVNIPTKTIYKLQQMGRTMAPRP